MFPFVTSIINEGVLFLSFWSGFLSGNGGTTLEFFSPFLWRAPPLEMRPNSSKSEPSSSLESGSFQRPPKSMQMVTAAVKLKAHFRFLAREEGSFPWVVGQVFLAFPSHLKRRPLFLSCHFSTNMLPFVWFGVQIFGRDKKEI